MSVFFLILIVFLTVDLQGQILEVTPPQPGVDDTVSIVYRANLGNGELINESPIYAHTGVLTSYSTGPSDWKYVKTDWCENTSEVLMEDLGNQMHRISFHIRSYYGIPAGEIVTHLAFVFRNENCSKVGRTADGGDIFYPIEISSNQLEYLSHSYQGSGLSIQTDRGGFHLKAFSPTIIRVSTEESESFQDEPVSVVDMEPMAMTQLTIDSAKLVYATDSVQVHIQKFPFQLQFLYQGDTLLRESIPLSHSPAASLVSFRIDSLEVIHGTGSRAIDLNLKGQSLQMHNQAHYGYGWGAKNLNVAIPFLVSSKSYGLYFHHHHAGNLNLTNPEELLYTCNDSVLSYFFVAGKDYPSILNSYTELTGKPELPPRWALGYIQSKYGYTTEQATREVVNQFALQDFPLDAIVLDLYWFGSTATMGNLDWDYSRFPNPTGMMDDFEQQRGVKTILITEPYFVQSSSNYQTLINQSFLGTNGNQQPYLLNNFWAGPAGLLNMNDSNAQNWMWSFYRNRILEGAGGWWCDLGEPENHPNDMLHVGVPAMELHNRYSLAWAEMLHRKYRQEFPEQRLFNLIRSGYAGMQRFQTYPWSGDVQRSYSGLQAQIPIMLNMGYSGVGFMHSDLGGFTGGGQNNSLYTRWMQLGTFSPVMRAHGVDVATEPYQYPQPYKDILRKFLKLRYQLIPYNYHLSYEYALSGIPLARAMDFYDSDNSVLQTINDQYFWGPSMLIAPMLEENSSYRSVYLPDGKWIHYFDRSIHPGNQWIQTYAPIETMPVFVKRGSIIPHASEKHSLQDYDGSELSLWYYPDLEEPISYYQWFNDDGQNPSSLEMNAFEWLEFEAIYDADSSLFYLTAAESPLFVVNSKKMEVRVINLESSPQKFYFQGIEWPIASDATLYENETQAVYFNESERTLFVKFEWDLTQDMELAFTQAPLFNGISEIENWVSMNVYPNPAHEHLHLEYHLVQSDEIRISLLDYSGRILRILDEDYKPAGNHRISSIDISVLSSGSYMLLLEGSEGVHRKSFIRLP